MTIISVAVFLIAAYGMMLFSKAHYSDVMDKAKANMSMLMSNVEISAENIIDELSWRGLIAQSTDIDELRTELDTPTTAYVGFNGGILRAASAAVRKDAEAVLKGDKQVQEEGGNPLMEGLLGGALDVLANLGKK